jgi:hypothetical protein
MPDAQTGLVKYQPDGKVSLTVQGTRHTLRQITLGELRRFRDLYEQWSKWWTEVIGTLSEKKLPEDGTLEPWMSETPRGIPGMFQHWRSVPLEESSAGAAEVIAALSQIGQAG